MRHALAFLLVSLVLSPGMGSSAFANHIEPGDEELLRTLIAHQDAAQKAMRSYVLEQEWTLEQAYVYQPGEPPETRNEDVRSQSSIRMVRKGEHYILTRDDYLETVSKSWSERRHHQCVLNADYFAVYDREQGNSINVWEHESIDTMRESPRNLSTMWYPKPFALDFAFGGDTMSLSQHFALEQKNCYWSVDDAELDGDPVYRITVRLPLQRGGREAASHYFLDPNRGFLLRGRDIIAPDGKLRSSIRVTLEQTGERWFPRRILYRQLDGGTPITSEMHTTKFDLTSPEIDKAFNIDAMKFAPDAYMQRILTEGGVLRYRYENSGWVSTRR